MTQQEIDFNTDVRAKTLTQMQGQIYGRASTIRPYILITAACGLFHITRTCQEHEAPQLLENIRDLFLEYQKQFPHYGKLIVKTEKIL